MEWKQSGIPFIKVGGKCVSLKTVWLKDKWGHRRRFRVRTVFNPTQETHILPSWSQLAKDERGRIGALIVGRHHSGWLKIGSSNRLLPYLFVSLDALPKKVRKKLLIPLEYELVEEEEAILAKEKEVRSYYVGSKRSNLFHEPGCWQAKRIKDDHRIIFKDKKQALSLGYTAHRVCGG